MIGELTVFIFSCIAWPITLSLAIISLAVYSGGGNGGTGCWRSCLLANQGIKGDHAKTAGTLLLVDLLE